MCRKTGLDGGYFFGGINGISINCYKSGGHSITDSVVSGGIDYIKLRKIGFHQKQIMLYFAEWYNVDRYTR